VLLKQEMGNLQGEYLQIGPDADILENRGGPPKPLFNSWTRMKNFLHRGKIEALKTITRSHANLVRVTGKNIGKLLTLSIDEIMPSYKQVFHYQPSNSLKPLDYRPLYYGDTKVIDSEYNKHLHNSSGDEAKEAKTKYKSPYPYWKAQNPTSSVSNPPPPYTLTEEINYAQDAKVASGVDEIGSLTFPKTPTDHHPKVANKAPLRKDPVKVQTLNISLEQTSLKKKVPLLTESKIPFTNFKTLNSTFTNFISFGEPTVAS